MSDFYLFIMLQFTHRSCVKFLRIAKLRAFGSWAFGPSVSQAFGPMILLFIYYLFIIYLLFIYYFRSQAYLYVYMFILTHVCNYLLLKPGLHLIIR